MKKFSHPESLCHSLEVSQKTFGDENPTWITINKVRIVRRGIPLDAIGGFRAMIRYLWEIFVFPNVTTDYDWQEGDTLKFNFYGREIIAQITDIEKHTDDSGFHHLQIKAS